MKNRILTFFLLLAFGSLCIFTAYATNPPTGPTPPPGGPQSPDNPYPGDDGDGTGGGGTGGGGGGCDCSSGAGNSNGTSGSIYMSIPFGKPVHQSKIPAGKIILDREKPSASLFTPQSLVFQFNLNSYLMNTKTASLPVGFSRETQFYRPNGQGIKYQFKTGESIATPIDKDVSFNSKLRMIDANGNPVTENPAYYERMFPNGSKTRFPAGQLGMPPIISGNKGEDITADSPDVLVEPIYRDNVLRQIWSAADGLADFVIVNDYKYEIRLYAPENAGSKNTQGLYEPQNSPFEVWTIENPDQDPEDTGHVRIIQSVNGTDYVYNWTYTEASNAWTVISGAGLRKSVKLYYGDYKTGNCQITEEVRDASDSLVSKKVSNTQKLGWGPAVVSEAVDPDGANLVTAYTYYTVSTETGKYGKVKTIQNPDGSWKSYDYDSQGRKTLAVSSYLDTSFNSAAGSAKAEYYSYTPLDSADALLENDGRPRTVETKILGNTVNKKYFVYKTVNDEAIEIEEEGIAAFGNSENRRKTTTYYANSANNASKTRVKSIAWSDGKLDTYTYDYGTYSANQDPASCAFSAGSGDALRQTIVHGTTSNSAGVAGKSTKETKITDGRSNEAMTETYAYSGSGYSRIAWNVKNFDSEHHVLASYNSNGTYSTATWNCCSKDSETTADGTQYTYSYNLLKQMISKAKVAGPATSYTYDVEGHVLSETISGGSVSLATSATYDLAGRITSRTDAAGLTTTYVYSNGGRTVTETLPGGFTIATDKYLDGRTKSVTGSSVVAKYYSYGVNTNGNHWERVTNFAPVPPYNSNYVMNITDALGRTVSEIRPSATGSGTVDTVYFYNSQGLLTKTTSTGKADTLYAYDDFNNRIRSALDLNSNGNIDLNSTDRVTESITSFQSISSIWYQVTENKVYNDSGNAVTAGITKKQLTGFGSGVVANSISIDINGNETVSTTTLDRGNKTVVQTVNVPDSTVDEVSTTVNGLLSTMSTKSSLSYSYSYDGLGRKTGDTDPRTGTSVIHYNSLGQIDNTEDAAGKRTSFTYESSTGRRASVVNALNKATSYTYNSRGQILTVRGDATYPLDYVYGGYYGWLTQLKTYRNSNLTNPDITTWTYQDATGVLLSKTYADNKSVDYTYTADGKLSTRLWSRLTTGNQRLATTYSYNLAGDMTGIDYSDSTPDVSFTYNRLGQQVTVTDAVGSRTFGYNGVFQLTSEAITGIYNKTINRGYDSLGRSSGMNISTEYDVDYSYDSVGRFSTLTNDPNGTNETYTYSYLANSNLISSITYPNDITVSKSYESTRDLVTSIENKYDTTTISKYEYSNDDLGRRTAMGKSGTAFSQSDSISYGYNDKSEVTSAVATNQTTYDYGFSFDPIGNRLTSTTSETGTPVTRNYTANQLNQYTAIDTPATTPTYDFDGNTTSCELSATNWSFTWDAENRLIAAEKTGQRLEFKYDYLSRRVEKKVIEGEATTKNERFVYDSFKQVERLNALDSNAIVQKFVWSGETMLSMTDSNDTYYYTQDANKNVSELIADDGTVKAHYEYSPFGKAIVSNGDLADDNPFRFSSEFTDDETDLVYYNFRYYNPDTGRWLSRDPIEEQGGKNLYSVIQNNMINAIDMLGLAASCDCSGNGGGLLGILWNLPNTALGLGIGAAGLPFSTGAWAFGGEPPISLGDNSIQFPNNIFMPLGALTTGNIQNYGPGMHTNGVIAHEGLHTNTQWGYGPLYFPAHILGATYSFGASAITNPSSIYPNLIFPTGRESNSGRTNDWFHRWNWMEFR